jgi:hypothetical protein
MLNTKNSALNGGRNSLPSFKADFCESKPIIGSKIKYCSVPLVAVIPKNNRYWQLEPIAPRTVALPRGSGIVTTPPIYDHFKIVPLLFGDMLTPYSGGQGVFSVRS